MLIPWVAFTAQSKICLQGKGKAISHQEWVRFASSCLSAVGWIRLPLEVLHIALKKLYKQALRSKNQCLIQGENNSANSVAEKLLELHP